MRTIDARWIGKALSAAERQGVDVSALRGRVRGERIPEALHCALWEELARTPSLPIDVAESMTMDDYDLLGLIGKTANTVREALERVARYLPIWTDAYTCRVVDDTVTLELDNPSTRGAHVATESALAELVKAIRDISGHPIVPRAVTYRHVAPADVSAHARFFGVMPTFDQPRDQVVLAPEDADRAVLLADRALREYLEKQLEDLYAYYSTAFATRLRLAIRELLPNGIPPAADVAKKFGMSARTLHRRLEAEGLTFGEVVEGEQLRVARALLHDRRLALADIAYRAGFSEPSAFSRAYRRWTGRAPSEDR